MREEVIGDCRLILGDCREVLPGLVGRFSAVIDPPFGINAARKRNSQKWGWNDYAGGEWDKERADPDTVRAITSVATRSIVWGGNYFSDCLPPSERWLIWDKCQDDFSLADCEMAWCSFPGAVRRLRYARARALQDGKQHPTQKPIAVMQWCLGFIPTDDVVADFYMGSGTTLVACANLGRRGIGIEIDPGYFDIACRRVEATYRQPRLFDEPAPKPMQAALL